MLTSTLTHLLPYWSFHLAWHLKRKGPTTFHLFKFLNKSSFSQTSSERFFSISTFGCTSFRTEKPAFSAPCLTRISKSSPLYCLPWSLESRCSKFACLCFRIHSSAHTWCYSIPLNGVRMNGFSCLVNAMTKYLAEFVFKSIDTFF